MNKNKRLPRTPCNPLIVDPVHDLEERWEVTCAACGYQASRYSTTLGMAQQIRRNHTPVGETPIPQHETVDWSEPKQPSRAGGTP